MNGETTSPADYKSGNIIVRKASISEFPALERMLTRAFDGDPGVNWVCLQDRHRTERITRMMSLSLHVARPFGEIYTTQDLTGAALWMPAGKDESLLTIPTYIRKGIGMAGLKHGISAAIYGVMIGLHKPKTPHWELLQIGVEPSLQGKGIGCALLQPILNQCDQARLPAYVVTGTEKNLRFYGQRGFKVMERLKLPSGFPETYCMWREPR